jgi:hypothetical protein
LSHACRCSSQPIRRGVQGTEMDSFTYVNIFETKGLEYLLLLCFWVLFVYLIRYLSPPSEKRKDWH